jgi:hypothetical protein
MSKIGILIFTLVAACPLFADLEAIGNLNLTNLNSTGYQAVSFYNLTGTDQGCQGATSEYPVCTGVTITDWSLTITFTNENPLDTSPSYGLFTSPLTFSWTGSADDIGPYDPTVNNGYGFTGGLSGTWEIPLNFGNSDEPACPASDTSSPSCDYQITQIEFSGAISPVDTPLELGLTGVYNGSDPSTYTVFNPALTFDEIWNVPAADYYSPGDPTFFGDPTGFDVLISDQTSVPEPYGLLLMATVLLAIACVRSFSRSRQRN